MLEEVKAYLDNDTDQAIDLLTKLIRIPSVAAKGVGIDEAAT